eukprot:CAMPEP_0185253346 /NCGR_PEP_ID=MMETSP1359-20130426/2137_1 /TAXON_ID=552665 /ORGANISM="Bigelowiella longifila, Strain CCMP242" /LENGTH=157 /DNA_ID=CAMNT_0027835713 /DNA_START=215 /DNA_END=688 /DNA_ORIENTATION=-
MTKQNFHCKPYKQKTKGDFKVLKFDLKKVAIGSKPYMRIYGNHKLPPVAREKPIRSKGQREKKDITSPSIDNNNDDDEKTIVKKEKTHGADLLHSHNWLMTVAMRNDGLANFVRPDTNKDGAAGTKRRNNDDRVVFTNIPPGEYFLKKNRVKRHKTC